MPGGPSDPGGGVAPTSPAAARATLAAHRDALHAAGQGAVWPRVRALVVQPGVEFDEWDVVDYDPAATTELREALADEPEMVFEAHSTDYQQPSALAALVRDHWAVLKVGPWLTFAVREALFALESIERELCDPGRWSHLAAVADERMVTSPARWEAYHRGSEQERRLARRFSYSDRVRYYWPDAAIRIAEDRLLANLDALGRPLPLPLLSQYLPAQYARARRGLVSPRARELCVDHVADVLRDYRRACGALE